MPGSRDKAVPSIVTTTAWVGSNQAILTLLELFNKQNPQINLKFSKGLEWDSGKIIPLMFLGCHGLIPKKVVNVTCDNIFLLKNNNR